MKRILTGDRPTGNLHLGHYFGTLLKRVELQDDYDTLILIADLQVLTDHLDDFTSIEETAFGLMCDYLGVGLKPSNTFFIQSQVPELTELMNYLSYMATVARVQRNPTLKSEAEMYGVTNMSMGFLSYPISQAADILAFKADVIPVGQDQMPHIELTRELARYFNRTFGNVFPVPEGMVGKCPILVGTDGEHKMSKSLDNTIAFAHNPEETTQRVVRKIVTDRLRIHASDPGHPDECTGFKYWCLFEPARAASLKNECIGAQIGCKACKQELAQAVNEHLAPIRERRSYYAEHPDEVWDILSTGTKRARDIAAKTLGEVREAMKLSYPKLKG